MLVSKMIYLTKALGTFLGMLHSAATSASALPAVTMSAPAPCNWEVEVVHPLLCLIAAKVLYFGISGGSQIDIHHERRTLGTMTSSSMEQL